MPYTQPDMMFVNGTMIDNGRLFNATSTTNGGNVVYYLTDTGTLGGSAVFSTVVLDSLMLTAVSNTIPVSYGTPTVSADKKTLTIPVYQPTTSSSVVSVLGINVLSGVTLVPTAAANGISVRMTIQGVQ
jgi:hypothetical protein